MFTHNNIFYILPSFYCTGRYEETFIEKRMDGLQRWMNRMTAHPIISQCDTFQHFISCTDEKVSLLHILCLALKRTMTSVSTPKDKLYKTHPLCVTQGFSFECAEENMQVLRATVASSSGIHADVTVILTMKQSIVYSILLTGLWWSYWRATDPMTAHQTAQSIITQWLMSSLLNHKTFIPDSSHYPSALVQTSSSVQTVPLDAHSHTNHRVQNNKI